MTSTSPSNKDDLPDRRIFETPQMVQVLENISDGFFTLNENLCFSFLSQKVKKLLRLGAECLGKNIWQEFPLLIDTPFYAALLKALAQNRNISIDELCPYTNLWMEASLHPCRNGITISYRDLTERLNAREEQKRFMSILEATTDFVCIADTKGQPTYLNLAGRRMLGIEENEDVSHIGFHPKWAADLILTQGLPLAIRDGVWTGETALLTRDEREIPVSQVIIAHKNLDGTIDFISTVARDISERIKAENQLRERAALLDQAPDAIMVCSLNHQIVYWNRGAENIYGWSAEEVIGQRLPDLLGSRSAEDKYYAIFTELLEKGEWRGEERYRTKSGREIIAFCHWTLVSQTLGHEKSILIINTDITEKKKLEEQFLRAQRLESIGTLANGIAHDLNNVLSPILLATRILSLKYTDDDSQQLLATLRRSAQRGADLVRQVLTYVRGVDGDRILLHPKHPIREVSRILRDTLPKSISVEVDVPPNLWSIRGDITQLYQVLMNLCLNARDAMPDGGTLKIWAKNVLQHEIKSDLLQSETQGDCVVIGVTDTGTGINPEISEKIFEPFFTTKGPSQGSGLGLSTVMGIVKSHQGHIELESQLHRGTTFKVYLPSVREPAITQIKREAIDFPKGAGETILVVDDEPDILQMTSETLAAYGYKTILACGGSEAIQKFSQNLHLIDLVLIDIMMPKLDGIGTIKELRKLNARIKIITTSGLLDPKKSAEATALGVSAFLAKPCLPGKMIQTIASVLNSRFNTPVS